MESEDLEGVLEGLHSLGFAWALRCCRGDRTEAEDVLHASYEKVLDGRARFDGRSAFKTWLFGVIRRTALEQHRWRWTQALRLGRWLRERPTDEEPAEGPAGDEMAGRLRMAMTRLSRRQAEVIHLVFYQDLTIHEAAAVLAMPIGTARTHYQRGKKRLRAILGSREGSDD
jgi:RNA polymerase sigma-70 factor (ECF subfamily)